MEKTNLSRRRFVIGSAAAGGGLALGMRVPLAGAQSAMYSRATPAAAQVNVWVAIRPDDTCVIRIARSEMGQGTFTGLAQLVAEELECDWSHVRLETITPGQNLAQKRAWGEMGTGGSRGIRTSEDYVRRGGAAARIMLLQAAAGQWNVPVAELSVDRGVITHGPSGRTTTYGKVAAAASKLTPPDPKSITLKDPKSWKIAGKPMPRLDTAEKLNGSLVYAIDVKLPGMLNAAIRQCPVFGGSVAGFDAAKVSGMPGVKQVVKVDDASVAVVADTWWHAKKALDALPVEWNAGENAKETSATIDARLKEGLAAKAAYRYRAEGDVEAALAQAAKRVEADYSIPFVAHATMEPMNCTVRYTPERAEAWVSSQNAEASLAALAETTGLPLEKCEVYRHTLGGGFGRRGGNQDYVKQAASIAKQLPGTPVKLVWSREEDMTHDFYRPIAQCRLRAGLDAEGNLVALHARVSGQSINAFVNPGSIADGKDKRQLQGWYTEAGDAQLGYTVPNMLLEYAMRNTTVPVGPWRGVNTNQNGIFMECFVEECARAAGKDSLEFRRALLTQHPKHRAVLEAAAQKGDWGKPLPAGRYRGIAQFMGYGSYSAATAEVSVENGKVRVHRMVLALDCGYAVNPQQIAAQVEGSVVYGLSALFYGENTVEAGQMVQKNFDTYPVLRLAQMPVVETVIVPSGGFWGGVGEPTICVVAPAVLNAVMAATGQPVRTLPLTRANLA